MLDLTISIINYRTKQLTENCLNSIFSKKWKIKFDVWVVDNDSGDGSLEYLMDRFPKVNFIASKKNLGFAGGHNLVLKKLRSRYALILNSDTIVLDDVLDKMTRFMDRSPDFGIASCKVLGFDGLLQPNGGDLPLGLALLFWQLNLDALGGPSFHQQNSDYYKKVHEVGWVSGNFMIIRREVLDNGALNDDYFMYFEDVEFCFKAHKKGFKVMINPEVSIKHLSGGSLDQPSFRQWLGEYRGLIYFYRHQFGEVSGFSVKIFIIATTVLRIIAFTLIGKFKISQTYAKVLINL